MCWLYISGSSYRTVEGWLASLHYAIVEDTRIEILKYLLFYGFINSGLAS